jgi:hypothetical protein
MKGNFINRQGTDIVSCCAAEDTFMGLGEFLKIGVTTDAPMELMCCYSDI